MRTNTLPRHPRTGLLAVTWRKGRAHQGENPGESYPVWPILGGAEDDDTDDEDDSDDDQDDDAGDKSDKDKDKGDGTDWKAEAEKWKAQSRKHEQRAKENAAAAKERDRLRREGMPEQERKIEEAVAKALAEERSKGGVKLARQAFLAAAKGAIPNAGDVADDVNLSRYVKDDGEVDEDGLAELVKRLAPKGSGTDTDEDDDQDDDQDERDTRRRRRPGRGYQGARNGSGRSKSKSGAVNEGELFEELFGRKPRTASSG